MIYICLALILDYIAADPYWYPHPVKIMGKYINIFEYLVRKFVSDDKILKIWGGILALSLTVITYLGTFIILERTYEFNFYIGSTVNIVFMWNCIALRCLDKEICKIYDSLKNNNFELARKQVSFLVSRDTENLQEEGITKAAVETAVENTSDGIIAPLFYMLIGGAPLAMAYKAINTMDSMVAYKNDKYMFFGYFPAKLDDIANYIPSRLTGYLMILWAWLTKKDFRRGFMVMKRDNKKSESPNAGWPESAAAGIMGISLCGPSYYFGKIVERQAIGESINTITKDNINTTRGFMYGSATLLVLAGIIINLALRSVL